jgi:hypothetical protein
MHHDAGGRSVGSRAQTEQKYNYNMSYYHTFGMIREVSMGVSMSPRKQVCTMVYCDRRLGNIERWYWGDPRAADMRIPDSWKDSVCFLCTKQSTGVYHYGGTAFFVSVPGEQDPSFAFIYIVTAKHCIEKARQSLSRLSLRLNRGEKAIFVEESACLQDTWIFSDTADIAIARFSGGEGFSIDWVGYEGFLTESLRQQHNIGIGDELYIPGLFTKRAGRERNIPILRSGMISAMPDEPLPDENTNEPYHAYLVEVRSIGGLSGSPVFVLTYGGIHMSFKNRRFIDTHEFYLLGVVRGHWDTVEHESEPTNAGIAIVTPIAEVQELLFREDLVKERRREERERAKQQAPRSD